jgi:hypothetical protein
MELHITHLIKGLSRDISQDVLMTTLTYCQSSILLKNYNFQRVLISMNKVKKNKSKEMKNKIIH